jgi:hypothetical protein
LSSPHIALFDDIRMQAQSNMDASGWSGHAWGVHIHPCWFFSGGDNHCFRTHGTQDTISCMCRFQHLRDPPIGYWLGPWFLHLPAQQNGASTPSRPFATHGCFLDIFINIIQGLPRLVARREIVCSGSVFKICTHNYTPTHTQQA